MRTRLVLATLLVLLSLPASQVLGQGTSATLSGTVSDASGALIPGVSITAVNNDTGVETVVISNASGAYNFASLRPGTYTVRAELSSFQTQTFTDVRLGATAQNRLDFRLQVAGAATEVEVSVSAAELLLESSSSVGDVLEEADIVALPNTTNNVLDLIDVMAGFNRQEGGFVIGDQILGDFAGVPASDINVVRDGVVVSDQRWPTGINATTVLNPDLVGEIKMILAPVDAETGRGNGQIQVSTRSGGNEYHGGAVWNVKNSALDANTWSNNSTAGGPITPAWRNVNEYTINFGGPIIENKTFFFALWDQTIPRSRTSVLSDVLSPCAQQGIFRYYDGWNNGPADADINIDGLNSSRPSVDFQGNPLAPATFPDGTAHNGILRHVSPFGEVLNQNLDANCSNFNPATDLGPVPVGGPVQAGQTTWDPYRTGFDNFGFFELNNSRAPLANTWEDTGDGLNVVGSRWIRTVDGVDNRWGIGEEAQRKQININIDHILNPSHKIAGSYSYESNNSVSQWRGWPSGYEGRNRRRPQVLSVNFTSTLSPNILNEARMGMARTGTNGYSPVDVPENVEDGIVDLLPQYNGLTLLPWVSSGAGGNISWSGGSGGIVGSRGGTAAVTINEVSPRWTLSDTMSWTIDRHSLRFGATYNFQHSRQEERGSVFQDARPHLNYGEASQQPITVFDNGGYFQSQQPCTVTADGCAGFLQANGAMIEDLLIMYSGSLATITEFRAINDGSQAGVAWNDPFDDYVTRRDLHWNEFNTFFKDDWKLNDDLTLNLGMRWDWFGVPYDRYGDNSLTMGIVGGGSALFGRSGSSYQDWMRPGERGSDVEFVFIGPGSANENLQAYPDDYNNFGPAVGFSYNVPWLGEDRTVFRGGYQVTYQVGANASTTSGILSTPPGSGTTATFDNNGLHFDLDDVVNTGLGVPAEPSFLPVEPVPVTDHDVSLTVFDPNYVSPYTQNMTASITHRFNSQITLDVRYIGTLQRKGDQSFDLNQPNLFNNGLFEALQSARAGDDPVLLDQLFMGVNFGGAIGTVDGVTRTGADVLRMSNQGPGGGGFRNALADGNFTAIADSLNDYNYSEALNPGLPAIGNNEEGWLLRNANMNYPGTFPENWIKTSPQFNAANFRTNLGHQNYHSMQTEVTVRPIYGVNFSTSYTWAKGLENNGPYTLPWDRAADYRLTGQNRTHNLRSYGTYRLPIGPNQLLFGNSSGVWARVAEGWEMSWIYNVSSGLPLNLTSTSMLYANSEPLLVDGASFEQGEITWADGDRYGSYFPGTYSRVTDPQCTDTSIVATSIRFWCDRSALVNDDTGDMIFRTPVPGEVGNYRDQLFGRGTWTLDMAISKRTQLTEDISMDIRVDAQNIFNHPTPTNPNVAVQGGGFLAAPFNQVGSKTGSRVFQMKARIDF